MRIISGNLKGRKIYLPTDKNTRPLKDMVKESIFNLLDHSNKFSVKIKKSNILDLFAGSGSFGLECLSRGAGKVIFVENYLNAIKILNKNIQELHVNDQSEIVEQDCFEFLDNQKNFLNNFKIIFIDPPYKEKKINYIIDEIKDKKILNKNGIIVIHRHKSDDLILSKKFKIIDIRSYGISKIFFGN